ncbi:MAG: hypothetical protein OEZ07_05275 [Dehalococcoidia bacterium]|nr:hypothetical protein [Dehalococcoidia bacterium]
MDSQGMDSKSRPAFYLWAFGVIFAVCFTVLIWLLGPNLKHFVDSFLPDQGASWYYWKLPSRDSWGMAVVWALYLGHQFSIWAAIYFAQRNLSGFRSPSLWGLPKYSLVALAINLVFVTLHLVETHLWFDGLAQDTPILTSQGSVIIMLAVLLILENARRGLFIGRKAGKPFTAQVTAFFRRSHMYVFSWALVYTFWFHPMATDPQLLSGFFYMFLLFTQVTLAWTWVHLNKKWIVLLESYVTIHAVVVALFNTSFFDSPVMWPMFFSGFAFMFVFTYFYAFGVNRRVYWLVTAVYVAFLIWLYLPTPIGYGRSIVNLTRLEFLWIPLILHGLAWLFAGLSYLKIRTWLTMWSP